MIQKLIILFLTFSNIHLCNAQTSQPIPVDFYRNMPGVELVDSISANTLTGGIRMSFGFSGLYIKLDSSLSFQSINYSCTEKNIITRGTWRIFNNRMLELRSKNNRQIFDIIKLDSFYFFITPADRRKFILALSKEINNPSAKADFSLDGIRYSRNQIPAGHLIQEFLGREIIPDVRWEKTFATK